MVHFRKHAKPCDFEANCFDIANSLQMKVRSGFWLTHLVSTCDPDICFCCLLGEQQKKEKTYFNANAHNVCLEKKKNADTGLCCDGFTSSSRTTDVRVGQTFFLCKFPRKNEQLQWWIYLFPSFKEFKRWEKNTFFNSRWCPHLFPTCIGWPHQITGQLYNWCSGSEILIISALQPSHYHKHSDVAPHLTCTEAGTS